MYDPFFDIFLYIKFEDVIIQKQLGSHYFAPSLLGHRILTGLGFTPNSSIFTLKLSKKNVILTEFKVKETDKYKLNEN